MKFKHSSKLQTTNQKLSGFKFILFCKMDQWDLMRLRNGQKLFLVLTSQLSTNQSCQPFNSQDLIVNSHL